MFVLYTSWLASWLFWLKYSKFCNIETEIPAHNTIQKPYFKLFTWDLFRAGPNLYGLKPTWAVVHRPQDAVRVQ